MKKILIMGLPGSGKTTFAEELRKQLLAKSRTAAWFNADVIRKMHNDWDFSPEGRIRQANRMRILADGMMTDYVICDFVAPTEEIRTQFKADFTIWMDTETKSDYEDTDKLFERPTKWDYIVKMKDVPNTVSPCVEQILKLG
jgi:adenylylsulfate kinase